VQWLPTPLAFCLNGHNIPTNLFMGRFFSFMSDYDMDFTCGA
jgi:hypothetical protein